MSRSKNISSEQKNKKSKRITIILLCSLAAFMLIAVGAAFAVASKITSNAVPIVSNTPGPVNSPTPIPMSDLPEITGEPDDIGEDYDELLPTSSSPSELGAESTAEPIYQKVPIEENVINIFIIGQDIRPNQSGRGRSDSMMILSYNRKEGKASIVSMMRDTWVPIKGYDWNRLNTPFRFGGPGLAINTINDIFNLDVQNYVIVNFEGMPVLVDKLGGVDVNISKTEAKFYNESYGWGISSGLQHLNGEQSLLHARNRKSNGGDFERIRRQQDIMLDVYKKMVKIRDPILLAELIGFMIENIQTNLSPDAIFSMGLEIVNKGGIEIKKGRIPTDKTWKYARKGGRSVITIDFPQNIEYLHELIYNEE